MLLLNDGSQGAQGYLVLLRILIQLEFRIQNVRLHEYSISAEDDWNSLSDHLSLLSKAQGSGWLCVYTYEQFILFPLHRKGFYLESYAFIDCLKENQRVLPPSCLSAGDFWQAGFCFSFSLVSSLLFLFYSSVVVSSDLPSTPIPLQEDRNCQRDK